MTMTSDVESMAFLEEEPPKVFLINLETLERWNALFNPSTLEERLEVKFNRVQVMGLSHERLQYQNTGNKTIPLEFFISQIAQDVQYGAEIANVMDDRGFLESLAYPSADIDFGYQGTPQVLFVWPNVLRMVGRVTSVEFMHRTFRTRDNKTIQFVARLDFEEDRDVRLMMADVRQGGGDRFNGTIQGESEEIDSVEGGE